MADWAEVALTTDDELTMFDRRMPQLAQSVKGPSGRSAYDGKRQAAKDQIRRDLRSDDILVGDVQDYTELKRAATFLELSLIYRDLSDRNDTMSKEKADFFKQEYEKEYAQLVLDLGSAAAPVSPIGSGRLLRA